MRMLTAATVVVLAASFAQAGNQKLNPYTPGVNGVTAPKVIADSAKQIALPEGGATGAVLTVSTVVRKDGSVAEVRVLDSSIKGVGLEDAAAATIRDWRFEPGAWRGMPVDTVKTMKIYLGDAAADAAATALPVSSSIQRPGLDPMFPVLRLPGERGSMPQLPAEEDPIARQPSVVNKGTCAPGDHCLHEPYPGIQDAPRLVVQPNVPVSK